MLSLTRLIVRAPPGAVNAPNRAKTYDSRPMARPGRRWLNGAMIDDYVRRIGLGEVPAGAAGLRALQEAHLRTVPFENLSIHLGEPIELDEALLLAKVVDRRRGGFCYELNGAFAALLRGVGYQVEYLQARVFSREGEPGIPYDHMALRVDQWLVDVGFGRFTRYPVRLDTDAEQADPVGTVRVRPTPDGDLDVYVNGAPQYRLDPRPQRLADFAPTCWYHQTSPASHFTRSLVCTIPTAGGQVTLSGHKLIETVGAQRTERTLSDREALEAYGDHFGIVLDTLPPEPAPRESAAQESYAQESPAQES
jgi:N-hydroxyarylamine O-acetyltransferase